MPCFNTTGLVLVFEEGSIALKVHDAQMRRMTQRRGWVSNVLDTLSVARCLSKILKSGKPEHVCPSTSATRLRSRASGKRARNHVSIGMLLLVFRPFGRLVFPFGSGMYYRVGEFSLSDFVRSVSLRLHARKKKMIILSQHPVTEIVS